MEIQKLIIDKYFDIYTRNGFEHVLEEEIYTICKFYLIDFDDIRGLNKSMGYINVNLLLKKVFSELKKDYTIGRAFSGDEIFFQTYDLNDDITNIKKVCNKYGLSFKHIEKVYNNSDIKIAEFFETMIENFH